MQKQAIMILLKISYRSFVLCSCIALLLSGCASSGIGGGSSTSNYVAPRAPVQLAAPKSDANGITSEANLRVDLAKVQQLMQGMSLDQKLGQLLLVEYLGNSYQDSGLQ